MDSQIPSNPPIRKPLGKRAVFLVGGILVAALGIAYFLFSGGLRGRGAGAGNDGAPHKTCVVVVPFRAVAGSEPIGWIGEAVPVFLSLSLEDQLELKVLTPERVFDLSKPAGLSTPEAELAMARKGGADYLLRGGVSGAPGSVRLSASWVEVSSGKERNAWTVEGISQENLGHKLDELRAQVTQALGPEEAGSEIVPLAALVPIKEEPTRSYLAGTALLAKGEAVPALEALAPALQLEDFPLARFAEAMAAAQRGDPPGAVRAASSLSKLARPMPARVTLLVPVFLALYQSGNPRTAVAPLESFLARFPDEKYPLSWLGAIELFLLNEPDRAMGVLKRALALDPTIADNQRLLGQATLEAGHPAEAISILENYLKTRPDDESARLLLAKAQRGAGKLEDASRSIDQVQARLPESIPAITLEGMILLDQGKPQEAAALYQKLLASTQPRSRAEGQALQARVSLLTGHFGAGLQSMRAAAEQARQGGMPALQGQYLMALARVLASLGKNQEALSTYAEVRGIDANLDPELPMISVLVRQKEYDSARHMMDTQIEQWRAKVSLETLDRLRASLEGNIALEQGKYADAIARMQAALPEKERRDPSSEALGRAYMGAGEAEKAAKIFQKIAEDPDRYADPVGYVQCLAELGSANEKLGKKDEAIRTYKEVLRWWGTTDIPQPETEAARQGLKRLGG
jgi:tetratricopeptide (TPR) repeat protein